METAATEKRAPGDDEAEGELVAVRSQAQQDVLTF